MALVQIGVKIDESVKAKLKALIDKGKYRDMTDFAVKAIMEKLEREDLGIQSINEMKELIERSQKIEAVIEKYEVRFKEIEDMIMKKE